MYVKLFFLATLSVLSSAVCPDSNDQEIKGLCFKFVAQQVTFNDARDWCFNYNRAASSYLAYVPNQETSNFLAFYARSAFGADAENFWIGLTRDGSSGYYRWDNGSPVLYTNFGDNIGNTFFTESISNTKWYTLGDFDKNYFLCSYDPPGNSTTKSGITTH
ncbi:C-type lectin domain-containing protein [Caenorhabditis elegans]|uniref:C-type lectin domain-containing protein n=1 Tax=Caenorhabditis elegans TaxID=6239 RepID=U4PS59_CAEEL|nr:C-type lectin domain-containing protein [Caenorhabditis elegans]CDH93426.1 C-type lectin domain-containing protein [Caenorhabditis elegans]|eukprot:NP_001294620.1 Uncharacterized protein CELE_Y46C8AM.1 [Caenorhabditis elegans]